MTIYAANGRLESVSQNGPPRDSRGRFTSVPWQLSSFHVCPRPGGHDPEIAVLPQPAGAFVTQQRAADLAGIVAQAVGDHLKTFRVLVAAEPVRQERGHAVGNGLRIRAAVEFEDGVHALPEFRIGEAYDDAGAHLGMFRHRGLDFRRIDVGAAAQNHVGEAVAEIEIAFGIQPSDIAERFPAVRAPLRLGAEIVIGRAGAVVGQEVDFAGLAGGDLVAVFADDAQARGLADLADRAAVFEPFNARYDRGALGFGAAIEFVDALRPQPLDPFFLQPWRHGRCYMKHDLQARQIVAVAHLLGQRPDPVH